MRTHRDPVEMGKKKLCFGLTRIEKEPRVAGRCEFVLVSSWLAGGGKRGTAARSSAHWPVLAFLCWQERQRGSAETRTGERRDERETRRRSWQEREGRERVGWVDEREREGETRCLLKARASRIEKDACKGTCARVKEVPARLHSQASSQSQGRSLLRRERATNQHGNLAA